MKLTGELTNYKQLSEVSRVLKNTLTKELIDDCWQRAAAGYFTITKKINYVFGKDDFDDVINSIGYFVSIGCVCKVIVNDDSSRIIIDWSGIDIHNDCIIRE